jgi:hypothetical protein
MELRFRETEQVITEQEFRRLYPNTSFPPNLTSDILDYYGLDPVFEGPQAPISGPYQISMRDGIEEINGKWFTKYIVGPRFSDTEEKTAEEQRLEYRSRIDQRAAESIRLQRDKLLQETDWIVIKAKETGTNLSAGIKTYRQALRDITLQEGFPHEVVWPEKP